MVATTTRPKARQNTKAPSGPLDQLTAAACARLIAGMDANGYRPTDEPGATIVAMVEAAAVKDRLNEFEQAVNAFGLDVQAAKDQLGQVDLNAPPPPADPWTLYTLRDAFKPRPPRTFIVEGLIPVPSLIVLYGPPGAMKSFLAMDMMICVAGNIGWLSPEDPSKPDTTKMTMQVPCLWGDFDNGVILLHERFEALARARGLPENIPLTYASMPDPWLDCTDPDSIDDLKQRILRLGAKLVILDNLGTISGGVDENSAEMIQVMASLRRLAEETSAAVVIIHHQRKSSGSNQTRVGDSLRGHSSIEAALDLALLVEREEQGESIIVKSTKSRGIDVYPFGARFDYIHKAGTKDLETARFWGEVVDNPNSPQSIKQMIIDIVAKQGPLSQTAIVLEMRKVNPKIGMNRIRSYVNELATLGLLIARPGTGKNKNAIFYEVP